jgi:flagellar assembly factor FliW
VIVKTGRFGQLTIDDQDVITIPTGVLGFPEYTKFCLVDAADDTLILWLQSLDNPEIAFAVLEPKVFKTDYAVRLSGAELRELKLENVNQSAVFSILTIPSDVTQMTANLKAPIVINLRERIAKQVVLQENEYSIKHLMFKELRSHLITIQSQAGTSKPSHVAPVAVKDIPPSLTVKSLQA